MPFVTQYRNLIESEKKVSKALIKPRNIYRILVYEYADGTTKSLAGPKATLVFVIGVFQKQIFCLKISEIKPDKFFIWLKSIFQKSLTNERIDESKKLEEITIRSDRNGSTLFSRYISGRPILTQGKNPYRTYNMDGIRQISEVVIKKDTLKEYFNK